MAAFKKFRDWAFSHSLTLPFKLSVKLHEDIVNFIHGSLLGFMLGIIAGLAIKNLI